MEHVSSIADEDKMNFVWLLHMDEERIEDFRTFVLLLFLLHLHCCAFQRYIYDFDISLIYPR